ncbi:hypothetical protein BGX20_011222 [Mortierella sp. AD010]|nr:hypothetical protein BGX20_011222 [Mortierella sp. AD010]
MAIQITINNAWKDEGAGPLLEKCQKISKLFKNKDFLANRLAKSQKNAEEGELEPVSMGTTRWNSRYEMTKRMFKMTDRNKAIVKYFTDNPTDLPSHINKDKVKGCL